MRRGSGQDPRWEGATGAMGEYSLMVRWWRVDGGVW